MTNLTSIIRQAQEALATHSQTPDTERETTRILAALRATTSAQEAGRLYDELIHLPAPPPKPRTLDPAALAEFETWSRSSELPRTAAGLELVSDLIEVYAQ